MKVYARARAGKVLFADNVATQAQKQSARKAEKALQQRIKLAHKGIKQAVSLPIEANKRETQSLKVVSGVEDSGAASAAQPVITRRGRNIELPNKYK